MKSITQLVSETFGTGADPAEQAAAPAKPKDQEVAAGEGSQDAAIKLAGVLETLVASGAIEKLAGRSVPTDEGASAKRGTVNVLGTNRGTSHPGLRTPAAAAAVTKGDVSRQNTPALRMAFKNPPYADPATGTILKTKVDHRDVNARLSGVRAEIARRKKGGA